MNNASTTQEIVERLEKFPPILQKQVLDFTLRLEYEIPKGAPIHNS